MDSSFRFSLFFLDIFSLICLGQREVFWTLIINVDLSSFPFIFYSFCFIKISIFFVHRNLCTTSLYIMAFSNIKYPSLSFLMLLILNYRLFATKIIIPAFLLFLPYFFFFYSLTFLHWFCVCVPKWCFTTSAYIFGCHNLGRVSQAASG